MVAVAVLVLIAIAGIVLATLRGRAAPADAPVAADATQSAASAMTAAPPSSAAVADAAAESDAAENQVVFKPGSSELSDAARAKLERIVETARKQKRGLIIAARVAQGPNGAERKLLAQNRGLMVRSVFEQAGLPMGRMQVRVSEEPYGLVSEKDANRVEVTLN